MRRLGFAIVIASTGLMGIAQAQPVPGACPKHNALGDPTGPTAQDPTVPGEIGGCGTGAYKLHQYKKKLKELQDQQQMIGPKATGSGENL
jgi:hypothetical protein